MQLTRPPGGRIISKAAPIANAISDGLEFESQGDGMRAARAAPNLIAGPAQPPEPSPGSHLWGAWMKQKEVRSLIIREWDRWLETQAVDPEGPTGRDSLKFYFELQDNRSTLLDFQSRGRDKWQIVHSWLLSERRVSD
jgi:hypothetical protein